ncbi:augurin isoform 2-T2 [Geothlypis trichas]
MRTWVHLLAIIFLQAASLIKEKCDSPHLVQGVLGRRLQPRGWIWERQNKRASHARHPHQSRGSRAPSLGRFLACLQEARHAEIKRNLFCGRKGRFFWPGIPILGRRQEAYCIKDVSRGNKLKLMLQKREASAAAEKPEVSVKETAAKEFLSSLRRQRRQLWDRSQPDVQQWYQQFLYLGFDEQKFEDDISYWTNLGRARNEYYGGHYQHHYDEDSPIGPRNPHDFRHGAGVNYDDY